MTNVARNAVQGPGTRPRAWLCMGIIWLVAALLAACGGGGGGDSVSTPQPDGTILTQPADASVTEGAIAVLSVTATGDVRYQWQRHVAGRWTDVPGATQARCETAPTLLSDDGTQYRVRITAGSRELYSSAMTLRVTAAPQPPRLLVHPADVSATVGGTAVFNVTASGTSPTFRWQRSSDGVAWVDASDGQAATWILAPVALTDDGLRVRVVVSNDAGSVTSPVARLVVQPTMAAPLFTLQPASVTATAQSTATFFATATGAPVPTLSWQTRSDTSPDWTDVPGASGGSLAVGPVAAADHGRWYRAVATNARGSVASLPGQLRVATAQEPPAVTAAPGDTTRGTGATATFTVAALVTSDLTYQWQVSVDGGTTFANITGATRATYTTPPAAVSDDGKRFRVVLTNAAGTTTSTPARLSVLRAPAIVQQPQNQTWRPGATDALFVVTAAGDEVRFQWQAATARDPRFVDIQGATGSSYLHAASGPSDTTAVRVVVSSPVGTQASEVAALHALDWEFVHNQPVHHALFDVRWVDDTVVVALGERHAIYRSGDAGATWALVSEAGGTPYDLAEFAFADATTGIVVGGWGVVKRTTDGGRHWAQVPLPPLMTNRSYHAVAFRDSRTAVLVGYHGTVLRSTDAGLSWEFARTPDATTTFTGVAFGPDGVGVVVGADGPVLRTINGGADWEQVHTGGVALRSVRFASDRVVVAGGADGTLLRSTDAGVTWATQSLNTWQTVVDLDFDPSGSGTAALRQGGLIRTADAGATWQWVESTRYEILDAVDVNRSGVGIAVGHDGIMRRARADESWVRASPWRPGVLSGVAFASPSTGVAVGAAGLLMRTTDGGAAWTAAPGALGQHMNAVAFADARVGVAVGVDGAAQRTSDAGATWQSVGWGSAQSLTGVAFASPTTGVVVSTYGMFRTQDAGLTWQSVADDPLLFLNAVAFGNAQVGVAVGWHGNILHTVDGGQTWTRRASPNTKTLRSVSFASPTSVVAVGDEGAHLTSSDGGLTWQAGDFGFAYRDRWFDAVHFSSPTDGIAVASYLEVLRTRDGGRTWSLDSGSAWGGASAVASPAPGRYVIAGQHVLSGLLYRNTRN